MKRIFKLIISILFYLLSKICSLFIYKKTPTFIILYYHGIPEFVYCKFEEQLDYLNRKLNFINLLEIKNIVNSRINIAITFDDALLSVLLHAQPVLKKRNIPFTVFVPTGYLGKVPAWDIDSSEKIVNEPVMTAAQLKKLDANLCTIGSHTVSHKNLTKITIPEAKTEMQQSKEMLEKILNKKVNHFSFPYGAYNLELAELARDLGYTNLYTINTSFASTKKGEFLFDRIAVSPEDWHIELYLKINGGYNWIGYFQKRRYLNNKNFTANK